MANKKILEKAFNEYIEAVGLDNLSQESTQIIEMRRSFFAGALYTFKEIIYFDEEVLDTEEKIHQNLEDIQDELDNFLADILNRRILRRDYPKDFSTYPDTTGKVNKVHYRILKSNDDGKWYIAIRLKLPEYKIDGLYILNEIYDSGHLNDWVDPIMAEHIKVKPIGFIGL